MPLPAELLARVYAKPLPEGSRTMWAALRRAYPDAMTDRHVYEAAISNLAFVYGASYETTANAAMHTLAALALDQDSQTAIVEVPPPPLLRVPRRVSWTGLWRRAPYATAFAHACSACGGMRGGAPVHCYVHAQAGRRGCSCSLCSTLDCLLYVCLIRFGRPQYLSRRWPATAPGQSCNRLLLHSEKYCMSGGSAACAGAAGGGAAGDAGQP